MLTPQIDKANGRHRLNFQIPGEPMVTGSWQNDLTKPAVLEWAGRRFASSLEVALADAKGHPEIFKTKVYELCEVVKSNGQYIPERDQPVLMYPHGTYDERHSILAPTKGVDRIFDPEHLAKFAEPWHARACWNVAIAAVERVHGTLVRDTVENLRLRSQAETRKGAHKNGARATQAPSEFAKAVAELAKKSTATKVAKSQ